MKRIFLTLAFLVIGMISTAQIRFIDKEYFITSVSIDPSATIKEGSPNLVAELGLVSYWKYVSANIQILPALEGGYMDYGASFGVNLTADYFTTFRYYGGVRLGTIKRGLNSGTICTYPLAGFEGGVDFNINETLFIGLRGTGDYRSDFKYSGADPEIRYSGFIKLGLKF